MRAKVTMPFTDLVDGEVVRMPGEVFEASEKRVGELAARGFAEPVAEKAQDEEDEKPKKRTAKKPAGGKAKGQ